MSVDRKKLNTKVSLLWSVIDGTITCIELILFHHDIPKLNSKR